MAPSATALLLDLHISIAKLEKIAFVITHTLLSGLQKFNPNGSKFSFSFLNNQSLAANPPTRNTFCSAYKH
jgi:hypothetical protein